MTFDELNLSKPLLDALANLGFTHPTTIQQKAFPVIMSGADVCGIAQTGTGKTFAYLLPSVRLMKFSSQNIPQMLVIVPTRELVDQTVTAARQLTQHTQLRVQGVYGGVGMSRHILAVNEGVDILVATPGRLLDLAYHGALKLKGIKKLVIDEVDEIFNLGFRTQLNNIFLLLPEKRQNILFSATMTPDVEALIEDNFGKPKRIEAAPTGTPLANIEQLGYEVPNFNTKVNLLMHLLQSEQDMTKVLVFVATKKLANYLYEEMLPTYGEKVGVIHSNKEQNNRIRTVVAFKEGSYRILIATDLIARGLDVSEVTHVVNMDVPDVAEDYIHRIGRTGRADKKGIAITLIAPKETENKEKVEALMQHTIPVSQLPDAVEISDLLIDEEKPKSSIQGASVKLPKLYEGGGAFHEKSAKNKKVNIKVRHADKMKQKYGKPKTRGKKK
ncbi:MAG: DEAD/DEAH box helicase [Sphingobacteriales bacterium]|nr:MAG: DEAD/DEAH box helicase [Sphingobacteriales bacterium]